jgi:predicted anti-sigma-YlaC factor YlaD
MADRVDRLEKDVNELLRLVRMLVEPERAQPDDEPPRQEPPRRRRKSTGGT